MTYCLAIKTNTGIVFASDSRTNAGVDYIRTYSKMHVFSKEKDRVLVLLDREGPVGGSVGDKA